MSKFRGMSPQKAAEIRREKGILTNSKLQQLRVEKGLSQSGLAAISGVPIRAIQSYEHKNRSIELAKLETILDLCIALDCKIQDIIEDKDILAKLRLLK